jgi:hypothetical protein
VAASHTVFGRLAVTLKSTGPFSASMAYLIYVQFLTTGARAGAGVCPTAYAALGAGAQG